MGIFQCSHARSCRRTWRPVGLHLSPQFDQIVLLQVIRGGMTLSMDYQGLKESNASFNGSTPVLIISGAGADLGLTEESFREAVKDFGIQGVLVLGRKVVAEFISANEAAKARDALHMKTLPGLPKHRLFVRYGLTDKDLPSSPEPACISATYGVEVPGLTILSEFITPEEEAALLEALDVEEQWDKTAVARRVQHFGYSLDFRARDVDRSKPTPPIPALACAILDRVMAARLLPHRPDQMTVNEYEPGQGISPHVDVHSCFEDGFLFLTLRSGIVMDFRRPSTSSEPQASHRAHWLPPRSIALLTGEARYVWTHGIASRKSDKVDGELRARGRRISLSFRKLLDGPQCSCAFSEVCDGRASAAPPPSS